MFTPKHHHKQKYVFVLSSNKTKRKTNSTKNMKKRHFAKTLLKPTKYQHLHLPGRSQGPLQTTKITPKAPRTPSRHPDKNLLCFRCLPRTTRGPPRSSPRSPRRSPRTPRGPPRTPGGRPEDPLRTPQGAPGPPEDPQGTPHCTRRLRCKVCILAFCKEMRLRKRYYCK